MKHDKACHPHYGIFVSWDSLQHHGHGVDRSSWLEGSRGRRQSGACLPGFPRGWQSMARMGGQVQVAQCIGRGSGKQKAHGFAQAAVQLAAVMGIAVCGGLFWSLPEQMVRISSACRMLEAHAGCCGVYPDRLRADRIFVS